VKKVTVIIWALPFIVLLLIVLIAAFVFCSPFILLWMVYQKQKDLKHRKWVVEKKLKAKKEGLWLN